VNREDKDLSESRPEISAVEAALAQLRPRRERRFADDVKGRMKVALSDNTPAPAKVTETVKIPLTHYIRVAQFNAAAGGLLAGLVVGVLLGGASVYFAMQRSEAGPTWRMQEPYAARSTNAHMVREYSVSLTPTERMLLEHLDKEFLHDRK